MAKGDRSILKIGEEYSNFVMNSEFRYFQYSGPSGIVGINALGAFDGDYRGPDRFAVTRGGPANANAAEGFSRSLVVPDSTFRYSLLASRYHSAPGDDGVFVEQKIESIFARQMALEGKASFSFIVRPELDIQTLGFFVLAANGPDDFSGSTEIFSSYLTAGVDYEVDAWQTLKFENIDVPAQGFNGLKIVIYAMHDGATFPQVSQIRVTAIQGNPGTKALPWRMMAGNDIDELKLLERYFEKTYHVDTAPGALVGDGAHDFFIDFMSPNNHNIFGTWNFKTPKRIQNPTFAFYSPSTGNGGDFSGGNNPKVDTGAGSDRDPSWFRVTNDRVIIEVNEPVATGVRRLYFHGTAQAEL